MQVVIPMSVFGQRFRHAGYAVPKPLIELDDKSIIAHIVEIFPAETGFIFMCNQDDIDEPQYNMKTILNALCSKDRIAGIGQIVSWRARYLRVENI